MIRIHIKTAIHRILKNKFYSFITIFGLVLGISVSLLMLMYVVNEFSYENFQKGRKNIYRIALTWGTPENSMKFAGVMPALKEALTDQFPEVVLSARIRKIYDGVLKTSDKNEVREESMFFADPQALKIFTFDFTEGSMDHALDEPFSAVITKSTASRYFGKSEPLGQKLFFRDHPLVINGVIEDVPGNTHFKSDILISYSTLRSLGEIPEKPWNQWGDDLTYILFKGKEPVKSLIPKLDNLLRQNAGDWLAQRMKFEIQPLSQIHWDTETRGDIGAKGNKTYVYIFLSAAILILIIACFNFLNLSINLYLGRMTEVAVRKTAGARQSQLISQFLTETMLMVIISGIIAVLIFDQFYLHLYSYLNTAYVISKQHFITLALLVLTIIVIVGLVAGSYPAILISRMRPIDILRKETYGLKSKLTFRKLLMTLQFAITFILIVGTVIIFRQLNYMKQSDLGFNKENVILLSFNGMDKNVGKKYDVLRDELLKNSNIRYVSGAYTLPGIRSRMSIGVTIAGEPSQTSVNIQALPADYGFIGSLDLRLVEGRDFSKDYSTDRFESAILNESAVKALGLKSPLGTRLMIPGENFKKGVTVIGVVRDFHIDSFHEKIGPMIIFINSDTFISIAVRINQTDSDKTLEFIRNVWNSTMTGITLNYRFLQSAYDSLYSAEEKSSFLLTLFAVLAVFISCLGLLGFVSYVAGRRIREAGIRKVLGAVPFGILILLSGQFISWILLSSLLAIPAAYLLAKEWLGNFAFHIEIEWWIFAGALLFELAVAFITITLQIWSIATRNPVEALRYE